VFCIYLGNCTFCPHCIYVFCIYLGNCTFCSHCIYVFCNYLGNCTFCPHCIYVFCIYLGTNSDLCHLQHKLVCITERKCLLRGTDWVFK
jgi:hypothetical protein